MILFSKLVSLFFEKILGTVINFLATSFQGWIYVIFRIAAYENPDILKSKLSPDKVKYFLFTKDNLEHYIEIDHIHPDLLNNPNVKIVFIIHGWMSSREVEWYEELKNAFLQRDESFYVVQVDWSLPANDFYAFSSWSTRNVGNLVGKLIVTLNQKFSVPVSNILIVGHSLGAQVASYVGKHVLLHTREPLPRIVALDPAGPRFNTRPRAERLSKHDAEVVQVIHTDGDTFGFKDDLHALDFFPNGGNFQPRHSKVALFSLVGQIRYSNETSPRYFASAVANPDAFIATKCNSWEEYLRGKCKDGFELSMGDLETVARGKFYLEVREE